MNSYLEVAEDSNITNPTTGFFVPQTNRFDIGDFEAMEARHPTRLFIHHTTSLARGIGTRVSTDFNNQMRQYLEDKVLSVYRQQVGGAAPVPEAGSAAPAGAEEEPSSTTPQS